MSLIAQAVRDLTKEERKEQPALPTTELDDFRMALQDYEKEVDPDKKAAAFKAVMDLYKLQSTD